MSTSATNSQLTPGVAAGRLSDEDYARNFADIAPRFDARNREAKTPGGIDGIEARKARSNDEHIAVERDGWRPGGHFRSCHVSVFASAGRKNASMSRHITICACVAGAKPAIVAKPWNSSG